jgi:hypothetical protein
MFYKTKYGRIAIRVGFVVLWLQVYAFAANHYVWCGATGAANGTEWTDAYIDIPASLVRGDTYYIAGSSFCSYGAHIFNDAESGMSVVSILHATAANSAIVGWQPSFATATANWTTTMSYGGANHYAIWVVQRSYYIFDGEFGSVGTVQPASGTFGFYLNSSTDALTAIYLDGAVNSEVITGINLNHTEISGAPLDVNNISIGADAVGTYAAAGNYSISNLSIYEDYMHDWESGFLHMNSPSNVTVDHSWFYRNIYTPAAHGDGVSVQGNIGAPNLTFSNDTWQDSCGTGVITVLNGTASNLVVYGNTFFQSTPSEVFPGSTTPAACLGNATIGDNNGSAVVTGARIHNNTFYNNTTSGQTGVAFASTSSNIVQQNNLLVNMENTFLTTNGEGNSESYNTILNGQLSSGFSCSGTGDSCQGTYTAITSSSVTSNVADIVMSTGSGLSVGSQVYIIGSRLSSADEPCGIDTSYPYPLVLTVVSNTEFQYPVQKNVPNATCAAGYGVLFTSPFAQPFSSPSFETFTLTSDTIDPQLNDGISLPAPYNIDPVGRVRGSDGNWDLGAYQFLGPVLPVPPSTLVANVNNL